MLVTNGMQKQPRIKVENTVQEVIKSKEKQNTKVCLIKAIIYTSYETKRTLKKPCFSPSAKREWNQSGMNSNRKSKMTKHVKLKAASKQPLRRNRARWSKKSDSFIIALKLHLSKVRVYQRVEKYIVPPMNLTILSQYL